MNTSAPIVYAAMSNNIALCQARLNAGLDINYNDSKRGTAIIQAIHGDYLDLTEWLLANGANLEIAGPDDKNAIQHIRSLNMQRLLEKHGVKFANDYPESGQMENDD